MKSNKKIINDPDHDYGCTDEENQPLDMGPEEFNIKNLQFIDKLSKTKEEIKTLEQLTKN